MESVQFCTITMTLHRVVLWDCLAPPGQILVRTDVHIINRHDCTPSQRKGLFIPAVLPLGDDCHVLLLSRIVGARELAFARG